MPGETERGASSLGDCCGFTRAYIKMWCPRIMRILGLQKTALRKIRVSGTVGGPLLTRKCPTCTYKDQNRGSTGPR